MGAPEQQRNTRRRELRALLAPYAAPSYAPALARFALDLALFVAASAAVVLLPLPGKALAALALGLVLSRLFILGHDACHQALTPSRRLNPWLGRIAFLPTYSTYSIWQAGHNVAHHGFTNLRDRDVPWVPLTPQAYAALSPLQRALYRGYRSWWGAGLYYGAAVWWRRMIFPRGKTRRVFVLDSWLVTLFLAAHVAAYVALAQATSQSPWLLIAFGIALPFAVWLYVAAIVFYVHHTDEGARWFDDADEWRAAQPDLDGTHDTQLPFRLDLMLHNVMRHTAHHVDPTIPCYRLAAAQRALARAYPVETRVRRIRVRRYVDITRRCQLYDAVARRWRSCADVEAARG